MTAQEIVGRNIRKYREKKKLSQEALADLAKIHRTYILQVEQGKRNVGIVNIFKIAEALEIDPSILLLQEAGKKKSG